MVAQQYGSRYSYIYGCRRTGPIGVTGSESLECADGRSWDCHCPGLAAAAALTDKHMMASGCPDCTGFVSAGIVRQCLESCMSLTSSWLTIARSTLRCWSELPLPSS